MRDMRNSFLVLSRMVENENRWSRDVPGGPPRPLPSQEVPGGPGRLFNRVALRPKTGRGTALRSMATPGSAARFPGYGH